MVNKIHNEDCLNGFKNVVDKYIQCIVTSPPYWGLRNYGVPQTKWPSINYSLFGFEINVPEIECCLGLEEKPEWFIGHLVAIFREGKRALKDDGILWVNIGDSYAGSGKGANADGQPNTDSIKQKSNKGTQDGIIKRIAICSQLKPKDLVGIPWMLAFALREDGWYLRCDIIWSKKNCMPESVTDRPTKSHEYIFLFSKSEKYYYDHEAIKELAVYDVDGTGTAARKARQHDANKLQATEKTNGIRAAGFKDATLMNGKHSDKQRGHSRRHAGFNDRWDNMTKEEQCTGMRNKRSVWTVSPAQFPEAHFATFPPLLILDCIKAGSKPDDIILDPFMGAGTTALVARKLDRNYIGFELNPAYIEIANKRLKDQLGMFI